MSLIRVFILVAIFSPMLFAQTMRYVGEAKPQPLGKGSLEEEVLLHLYEQGALINASDRDDFRFISLSRDELGQSHLRFQQMRDGLTVYGSHIVGHVDEDTRTVLALTGDCKTVSGKSAPSLKGDAAITAALRKLGLDNVKRLTSPELCYVVTQDLVTGFRSLGGARAVGEASLAYMQEIFYDDEQGPQRDQLFADAHTGDAVAQFHQHMYAKNRLTYTAANSFTFPGTLIRTEGQGPTGDSILNSAHDFAGITYDYFNVSHGRDSWDGAGANLSSTVHYGSGYNNAFWTGSQMVYGDGDGSTFIAFPWDLDVVTHEISHGVSSASGLIYSGATRALHEHMSDTFASAADAWSNGLSSNTWHIGDVVFTPATPGDALRYMEDPFLDGVSSDYYPTLTGVGHWDAGVGNLAFYLLSQGGTHPQGKTTVSVTGIGITSAAQIWYRALTTYLPPLANYPNLCAATILAATDLFGPLSLEVFQVTNAWSAVGVCSNGNIITVQSGLSAPAGGWIYVSVPVPPNVCNLNINTISGTGDADLYTSFGAVPPSLTSYACQSSTPGNSTENCIHPTPAAGTWWYGVYGVTSYNNVLAFSWY